VEQLFGKPVELELSTAPWAGIPAGHGSQQGMDLVWSVGWHSPRGRAWQNRAAALQSYEVGT
jgi:hypothetical protein